MHALLGKLNRFLEVPLGLGPRGLLVLALLLAVPEWLARLVLDKEA